MKTIRLFTLGVTMALVTGIAATAIAGPPYDAGFKARGMKEQTRGRVTRTYAAPAAPMAAGRQAFSYEPQGVTAAVPHEPCGKAVAAQTPQVQTQVRRYSYEPAPAPVYRTWNTRGGRGYTGYGGDYPSKATLKY